MGIPNVVHNVGNFQAIMNEINKTVTDIMNGITNNKRGHNIMNDIEQLCMSQMAYL